MGKDKKKKGKKKKKEPAIVVVPHHDDMDDETFILHLEKRHREECKVEGFMSRYSVPKWIGNYRVYHDRLHDIATPDQYDHDHEERGCA
jgi:hypothetical protein